MIRGTSQPFQWRTPYDSSEIKEIRMLFWQPDNEGTEDCTLPLLKTKKMCSFDDTTKTFTVTLNQAETFAFKTDRKAYVQFRAITTSGFVFGIEAQPITVYPIEDETIME